MMRLFVPLAALTQAGVALFVSAGSAAACAICLAAVGMTPGEQLDFADRAVLAAVDNSGDWKILEDIKGDAPIEVGALSDAAEPFPAQFPVLFLREGLGGRWVALGEVQPGHADWLRAVALAPAPESRDAAASTVDAWAPRLALAEAQLKSSEPQVAAIAHGDLGRAPYAAIRNLGRTLSPDELLVRVAQETDRSRRAAYILLLGGAGGESAAIWLHRRSQDAWEAGDPTDLAALLAARIETDGSAGVEFVAQRYLVDRSRNMAEIEAALLALSVQGDAEEAVGRADIVAAYEEFLRARPAMAGFVAMDLARWEEWGATEEYVALLNDRAIKDPAGAFAALSYVQRSTDMAAKARLDLLDD